MAGLSFDDIAPPPAKGNALSFDDIVPEDDPRASRAQIKNMQGGEASTLDKAAAILEQPGAMTWHMGSAAVGGVKALLTATMSRVPGMAEYLGREGSKEAGDRYREYAGLSWGDTFSKEFNRVTENAANMYVPLTTGGERLTAAIGEIFHSATGSFGNDFFEKGIPLPPLYPFFPGGRVDKETPFAGALGETASTAALFLLGGKRTEPKPGAAPSSGGKAGGRAAPPPTPGEVWNTFKEKYPAAAEGIEAMEVGRIRMDDFHPTDKSVYDVVGRKLDDALQLPDDKKGMTLEGKIRQAFKSVAEDVPAAEVDKAVRATLEGLRQMDALRVSRADSGIPYIREPAVSKEPIVVTKDGVAITAEQAAASDAALAGMSVAERADALGMSAMGRMRLQLEEATRLRAEGKERQAYKVEQQLKRSWARNFPYRDPVKRSEGLERFENFGGRMTYEESVAQMGPPIKGAPRSMVTEADAAKTAAQKKQGGYINPMLTQRGVGNLRDALGDAHTLKLFTGTFRPEEIRAVEQAMKNPKSRDTVVWMSPDEFLTLAKPRPDWYMKGKDVPGFRQIDKKRADVRSALDTEKGLDDMPTLYLDSQDASTFKVTAHDGRHRADVFKERGLDQIPVRVEHRTWRWGEQEELGVALPKNLRSESGEATLSTDNIARSRDIHSWQGMGGVGKKEGGAITPPDVKGAVDDMIKAVRLHISTKDKGPIQAADKKMLSLDTKGMLPEVAAVVDNIHRKSWAAVNNPTTKTLFEWNDALVKASPVLKGLVSKKQRGMLDIEGLGKLGEDARKSPGRVVRPWQVGSREQERPAFDKLQSAFDKSRAAEENAIKNTLGDRLLHARRSILGHDIDLKNALEKAGPFGEKVRLRIVRQHGATDAARAEMHSVNERIFGNLTKEEKGYVDDLMRARRIIEIQSYNPKYKIPEGVTGLEAEGWARELARKLGPDAYGKISAKTDAIITHYRKLLLEGLDSGLISKESFDRLIHFEYSPTEYINLLDPIEQFTVHGKSISIRGSGIQDLGSGKVSLIRMDSQDLLAEAVARMRNRQFKNDTLDSLWSLAENVPENRIVKIAGKGEPGKHAPTGWTKLGLRREGVQKEILMKDDFAEQFVNNPQAMQPHIANTVRVLSGSAPLRATAVGMNPAFIVAGIPMDILHTWVATSRAYSPHLPVYLPQIASDMMAVLPDLVGKKGRYKDAMSEGLGAHFMASYGMHIFTREKTISERMMPKWEKTRRVLQGFNQEADLLIRLAHRERLIKQGMPSEQATAMARDRLDYSQGGELIKGLDNAIPWTNVGVQALYKAARAAKRDPADFATKIGWLAGAIGGSVLANMIASPETWKAIPSGDKVRGLNITFGDQLYVIDPDGNKRFLYVPIRMDQVAAPISGAIVGGLEMAEYGKIPDKLVSETVSQSINLLGGADLVPSISALVALSGWDAYRGRQIYSGSPVKPEDETRWTTSPISQMAGSSTSVSPMRLDAAFGKLASQNNMWLQLSGAGVRMLLGDSDPREKAKLTEHFIAERLRPIVKLTNPLTSYIDGVEDKVMEVNSVQKRQIDEIDKMVFAAQHGQGTMKDVQRFIESQPGPDRERLVNRAKMGYFIDQIMTRSEAGSLAGVPPKTWWNITGTAPAEARAQEFHSKWISADLKARKKMENIALALQRKGTGYMSDAFKREWQKERARLGDDQR